MRMLARLMVIAVACAVLGFARPAAAEEPQVAVGVWQHDYLVDLTAPLRDAFVFHMWYAFGTNGFSNPDGIAWADISAPIVPPVSVYIGGVYVYRGGDVHIAPVLGARADFALSSHLSLRLDAGRIPVDEVEIGGRDAGIWTGYTWSASLRYAPTSRWFVEAGNRVLRFEGSSISHEWSGPYALVGITF